MVLTHGANSLDRGSSPYKLPFRDGAPLVYNGKSYRSKKVGDLLMMIDFFDEPVGSYQTPSERPGVKYYKAYSRFTAENCVKSIGWRLPSNSDIDYISNFIKEIHDTTGYSYKDLIYDDSDLWNSRYRGSNLTGIGNGPTGYMYLSDIGNLPYGWAVWGGASTLTSLEKYNGGNYAKYANWNNENYLPIIFVKDA